MKTDQWLLVANIHVQLVNSCFLSIIPHHLVLNLYARKMGYSWIYIIKVYIAALNIRNARQQLVYEKMWTDVDIKTLKKKRKKHV